ncbi:MAG TPA: adenylyl-sulfate kinase [Chitinophagaceae bacterium]
MILQFTGLSGAGKTSIAEELKQMLESRGVFAEVIDGDKYRQTICKGLGFSKEDRCENIRRLGKVAHTFSQQGVVAIISAINPYDEVRKELIQLYNAKVIWINCDMRVLVARDTKGLYKRALLPDGHPDKIYNLTGVNDVYEAPVNPDLVINSGQESLEESAKKVFEFVSVKRP